MLEIEKAYHERQKQKMEFEEQIAWLTGNYNLASIGVAFSKKSLKYPENPAVIREKNRTDFSEAEKEKYVKMLFGQLDTMKKSFESTHKGE